MTINALPDVVAEPFAGADPLRAYVPGESWLLASSQRVLLARGIRETLPADAGDVAGSLRELCQGSGEQPLAVGAIPFSGPAHLIVPRTAAWAPALPRRAQPPAAQRTQGTGTRGTLSDSQWRLSHDPAPDVYRQAVATAVQRIRAGEADKVVLARTVLLEAASGHIDLPATLHRLAHRDPAGYTFAYALPEAGNDTTLIGASPELLVALHGRRITSNPLAGTVPRSADPVEDLRRARALLADPKSRHEHALVVEAVRRALAPLADDLRVPAEPSLARTAGLWHLSTRITGLTADPAVTALDLANALHPTPAVCGTPADRARTLIDRLEPFDRGWFTGAVGWCDAAGDGEWVVAIRCATVGPGSLRLYAGAGIVADSDPQAEFDETTAKLRTFLTAAGADHLL